MNVPFTEQLRVHGFEKQLSGIDLDVGRSNPSAERRESMAYGYQSLSFDRHNPTTAIGQLEYTIPSPPIHVHVYVSMQRGNT